MKKNNLNIIYTSVLILIAVSCGNHKSEKQEQVNADAEMVNLSEEQFKIANILTDTMHNKSMSYIVKVSGKIDVPPQNMVSVSAPLGGFLKSSKLLPGMHLNKGEVIAIMEDQQYIQLQQDYLSVNYELVYLEKEYLRQKELADNKAVSDKSYEQSLSAYKMKLTDKMAIAEKLKMIGIDPTKLNENTISSTIKLYSPINGYVSQVKFNIGKYVQASEVLFDLVNPEDIHLNMTVFEKDLRYLAIGQRVNAYNNSDPEKIYPCEIILIGQDVSADRHVEVHCHFEKYDRSLIPGMYMNAEIETRAQFVKVIKSKAIVSFQGKKYVFVESGKHQYKMIEVELGISDEMNTEIINSDALNSQMIVINGAYELLMMLKNVEEEA